MEEWQNKPAEDYTKIFKHLKVTYREVRGKIKFPITISELETVYRDHLTTEFKEKLCEECPDLRTFSEENFDSLLEHHVLNPLGTKNFMSLRQKVEGIATRFLTQLDFTAEIDETAAREFIDRQTPSKDEAMLQFARKFPRDDDPIDEVTYSVLNGKLETILSILRYGQKAIYLKYGCSDYYSQAAEEIKENTIQLICTELEISYGKVIRNVTRVLKKAQDISMKKFKEISENELVEMYLTDPKVSNYIESYKSISERLINMMKDNVSTELGEAPNDVFLFQYAKEIKEKLEKSILVEKLYKNVIQDPVTLHNTAQVELKSMLEDLFLNGRIRCLFDDSRLGGAENAYTVFRIILLTDYVEYHEGRYNMYFEVLERIYEKFIEEFSEEDPMISEIWEMINTKEGYLSNRKQLDAMLTKETEAWADCADLSNNLFALLSVFVAFNAVPAENMSTRYTNHLRSMLKSVFRNFQNGMYRFTNFQILCSLESLILDFKAPMRSKSLRRMDTTPLQRDILEKIRKTSINSFSEQASFKEQLASLEAEIHANIAKPNKFIFEKISNPSVKSKSIIICVSGFTSEDSTKSVEWKDIPKAYPNSEVIALHWRSNTMNELMQYVINEANEVTKAKEGLVFGFALPSLKSLTLGVMAYKAIKGLASEQWGMTYKEAITTGIYLAHILADTDLFKDYVINLMSFSLGTMVVMNCIWELERMNRHDVIYDVILMGGVINVGDFNQGAMSVIGHKLINCYCYNDYVLRYILRVADFGASPIGLGPILSPNKKVENINLTKEVEGHTYYRENLYNIIARIDFNEDYRYLAKK